MNRFQRTTIRLIEAWDVVIYGQVWKWDEEAGTHYIDHNNTLTRADVLDSVLNIVIGGTWVAAIAVALIIIAI